MMKKGLKNSKYKIKRDNMIKIKILYKKYEEIINYIIVGIVTTFVSILTYYFLRYTILNIKDSQWQIQIANIISFIFAVLVSYILNHTWVFKSNKKGKEKLQEFINFVISRLATLAIDTLLMYIFTASMKINDKMAKIIVQIVIIILNYIVGKFLVFKKTIKSK